ncbi:MAG: hypothetical protein SAJ12_19520 [Jaaginema sp. PMC 1079.18]|nr:hypothetical protein [Jaaginema sp. PMC 1080.18]MEC4853177.1 hypothetical protein [Jaaginema sp. PMC 1079.18]MEC4868915.1 hypothetical protein [Jaaginema sp. PMC 1078.18]
MTLSLTLEPIYLKRWTVRDYHRMSESRFSHRLSPAIPNPDFYASSGYGLGLTG